MLSPEERRLLDEGLTSYDAGEFVSWEQVEADAEAIINAAKLKLRS